MSADQATLYMISGKIAAGKSTLATQLAAKDMTVLMSEDHWLSALYPDEIKSLQDYAKYAKRLRQALKPHLLNLLQNGLSVVMDFPANTIEQRDWLKSLFEEAQVNHELHFIDLPDEVCKERLHKRNAQGDHAYQVSDEQFDLFTSYFVAPTESEGFTLIRHQN